MPTCELTEGGPEGRGEAHGRRCAAHLRRASPLSDLLRGQEVTLVVQVLQEGAAQVLVETDVAWGGWGRCGGQRGGLGAGGGKQSPTAGSQYVADSSWPIISWKLVASAVGVWFSFGQRSQGPPPERCPETPDLGRINAGRSQAPKWTPDRPQGGRPSRGTGPQGSSTLDHAFCPLRPASAHGLGYRPSARPDSTQTESSQACFPGPTRSVPQTDA